MNINDISLDQYNIRSRLYPVLLFIGPIIAYSIILIPDKDQEVLLGFSLVLFPIAYILISIVRSKGKKIEDDIFSQGENMPTHRAIEDAEFLEEIGIESSIIELLPSKNNTEATVRFIINRTRNSKEFPIVFDTLWVFINIATKR
ncbi:MAG: hypothetical protein AAFP82_04995 [Bacteroidota bacterium]